MYVFFPCVRVRYWITESPAVLDWRDKAIAIVDACLDVCDDSPMFTSASLIIFEGLSCNSVVILVSPCLTSLRCMGHSTELKPRKPNEFHLIAVHSGWRETVAFIKLISFSGCA